MRETQIISSETRQWIHTSVCHMAGKILQIKFLMDAAGFPVFFLPTAMLHYRHETVQRQFLSLVQDVMDVQKLFLISAGRSQLPAYQEALKHSVGCVTLFSKNQTLFLYLVP